MESFASEIFEEPEPVESTKVSLLSNLGSSITEGTTKNFFDDITSPYTPDSKETYSSLSDSAKDSGFVVPEIEDPKSESPYEHYTPPFRSTDYLLHDWNAYNQSYRPSDRVPMRRVPNMIYPPRVVNPSYNVNSYPFYCNGSPEYFIPARRVPVDSRYVYPSRYPRYEPLYSEDSYYDGSPVESENVPYDISMDDPAFNIIPAKIHRGEEQRTVVLVRNIPNRLRKKDVTRVLANCVGYDNFFILRLPVDPFTKRNLGYAFVCFSTPHAVATFYYNMNGQRWPSSNSQKRCTMCFAKKQNRVPASSFGRHDDDDDDGY
ncbi:hypothetical protein WA158_001928 [Blastocystis sp. Blastoise]